MILNPARTGVALGSVIALWHLVWSSFVAFGWAKPLLDFVLWLHFLQVEVTVQPFEAGRAAMLVAVTFAVGGFMGAIFALIWNRLHRVQGVAAQTA